MTLNEAIRDRIIELCTERQITVNKLSTLCGITQSTLSNIISLRNRSTTISTVKKICDGLGITLADFFDAQIFHLLEQEIR